MFSAFQFSTSVFSNGLYPGQWEFLVAFQYPNRTYRAQNSYFDVHWAPDQNEVTENRRVTFALKNMEVLRRRDKGGSMDGRMEVTDPESFFFSALCFY